MVGDVCMCSTVHAGVLTEGSSSPPHVIMEARAPAVQAAGPGLPVRWDQGGGGQARSGQLCSSASH